MITAASLKTQTSKDLAQLAKKKGVQGWHSMRKEQLIKALLKVAKNKEKKNAKSTTKTTASKTTKRATKAGVTTKTTAREKSRTAKPKKESKSAIALKLQRERQRKENLKNLSLASAMGKRADVPEHDRVVLIVRDAYWIQAYWEVTKSTVQRAKVALNGCWHEAKPVLRVLKISSDGNTNSVEEVVEEIEIHSGVNNWYIQNPSTGKPIRLAIGYSVPGGKFHLISKSNQATPPTKAGGEIDEHWTDITNDVEKYYALSGGFDEQAVSADLQAVLEEKSQQSVYAPAFERLGSAINVTGDDFDFQVDAHMIVFGSTDPKASVTVGGKPVRLQEDGSFALRVDLPERRQVLPVVAANRNGTQQRTTVLAIERNTKVMEPVATDMDQ
ncbi:MAG: DUF4912 domain-containing protein [Planctomycetota bacterium]